MFILMRITCDEHSLRLSAVSVQLVDIIVLTCDRFMHCRLSLRCRGGLRRHGLGHGEVRSCLRGRGDALGATSCGGGLCDLSLAHSTRIREGRLLPLLLSLAICLFFVNEWLYVFVDVWLFLL